MAKVRYIRKVSSAAHGGQGFELEVEVDSKDTEEQVKALGEMAVRCATHIIKYSP